MALFYTGKRPVTKGRDYDESIHTYKGTAGTYSNWALFNESNVLDGAPNTNTVLGDDSRLSRPTFLEYLWSGGHHIAPANNAGGGIRLDGFRFRPLTFRGLPGAQILGGDYGHDESYATAYARYTNFIFDGLAIAEPLNDPGHAVRYSTTYGGASRPHVHQGVDLAMDSGYGSEVPDGYDYAYGYNKINEWRGVPASKAL